AGSQLGDTWVNHAITNAQNSFVTDHPAVTPEAVQAPTTAPATAPGTAETPAVTPQADPGLGVGTRGAGRVGGTRGGGTAAGGAGVGGAASNGAASNGAAHQSSTAPASRPAPAQVSNNTSQPQQQAGTPKPGDRTDSEDHELTTAQTDPAADQEVAQS